MSGQTFLMDPRDVLLSGNFLQPSEREIARQGERLDSEGQIEPIVVFASAFGAQVCGCDLCWAYADAQVMAARKKCWDTILVTYEH